MGELDEVLRDLVLVVSGNKPGLKTGGISTYERQIKELFLELIDGAKTIDLRSEKELKELVEAL